MYEKQLLWWHPRNASAVETDRMTTMKMVILMISRIIRQFHLWSLFDKSTHYIELCWRVEYRVIWVLLHPVNTVAHPNQVAWPDILNNSLSCNKSTNTAHLTAAGRGIVLIYLQMKLYKTIGYPRVKFRVTFDDIPSVNILRGAIFIVDYILGMLQCNQRLPRNKHSLYQFFMMFTCVRCGFNKCWSKSYPGKKIGNTTGITKTAYCKQYRRSSRQTIMNRT